jgi:hypothetical protein
MSLKDLLKGLVKKRGEAASSSVKKQSTPRRGVRANKSASFGVATQFEDIDASSPRKQLVIGLDFGTAFTKVVVGEVRLKMAIPLRGSGDKASDYLLPTVYWLSRDGKCSIDSPSGEQHADLKMSLIEGNAAEAALRDAAAYLALVLRRVRGFVFDHKSEIYGGNFIDWRINVGLPTDSYHDEKLTDAYKKILGAAWTASAEPGAISAARVDKILSEEKSVSDTASAAREVLHPEAISSFPEFVAQITGYVRSPLRQPDLHLLVDVGAGTLDVTVFNVHEDDEEDKFPIFDKAVKPLGTRFLTRHRINGTGFREEKEFAPFAPVPSRKRFLELLKITEAKLAEIDKPFRDSVSKVVGDSLRYTKSRRYPLSRRWEDGVPIFLCGGGSKSDFYSAIFNPEDGMLLGFPLRTVKLPRPEHLETLDILSADYDRMSVAYGLSFDPYDIGEIVRKEEVSDVKEWHQPEGNSTARTIICPRCNGTGGLHGPCGNCGGSGFQK